jgi:hypothetical protein
VKDWPTDPMRQHNRFITAFCDDLFNMCVMGTDPKSRERIAEINHQINRQNTRDGGTPNKLPPSNS